MKHYLCYRPTPYRNNGLRSAALCKGNTPPGKYTFQAPYLALTLYRNAAGAVRGLSQKVLDSLNRDEQASWQFIAARESMTSPELMKRMKFDERKAQRVLNKLQGVGLLRRVGKGPATRYEVIRP